MKRKILVPCSIFNKDIARIIAGYGVVKGSEVVRIDDVYYEQVDVEVGFRGARKIKRECERSEEDRKTYYI